MDGVKLLLFCIGGLIFLSDYSASSASLPANASTTVLTVSSTVPASPSSWQPYSSPETTLTSQQTTSSRQPINPSHNMTSVVPGTTATSPGQNNENKPSKTGLVVGISVFVVLLVLCAVLAVLYKRKVVKFPKRLAGRKKSHFTINQGPVQGERSTWHDADRSPAQETEEARGDLSESDLDDDSPAEAEADGEAYMDMQMSSELDSTPSKQKLRLSSEKEEVVFDWHRNQFSIKSDDSEDNGQVNPGLDILAEQGSEVTLLKVEVEDKDSMDGNYLDMTGSMVLELSQKIKSKTHMKSATVPRKPGASNGDRSSPEGAEEDAEYVHPHPKPCTLPSRQASGQRRPVPQPQSQKRKSFDPYDYPPGIRVSKEGATEEDPGPTDSGVFDSWDEGDENVYVNTALRQSSEDHTDEEGDRYGDGELEEDVYDVPRGRAVTVKAEEEDIENVENEEDDIYKVPNSTRLVDRSLYHSDQQNPAVVDDMLARGGEEDSIYQAPRPGQPRRFLADNGQTAQRKYRTLDSYGRAPRRGEFHSVKEMPVYEPFALGTVPEPGEAFISDDLHGDQYGHLEEDDIYSHPTSNQPVDNSA